MPAMPGATIALTRPPAASASSNTLNPEAGVNAGARSTSSSANRTSGLSLPNRSITSS
jgi:hypothetical protein